MIFLSNLESFITNMQTVNEQKSELLDFYHEMYHKTGREKQVSSDGTIVAPVAGSNTGIEVILKTLKPVVEREQREGTEPLYYFDIRSSENYSLPSPDYFLLFEIGVKHTKPINLRGVSNIGLIHALRIAEILLDTSEVNYIVASASQRLEPRDDRNKEYILADGSLSFAIRNGIRNDMEGYYIHDTFVTRDYEVFQKKVKEAQVFICRNNKETMEIHLSCLERERYHQYDFGCMDTLYSLLESKNKYQFNQDECIMLVAKENGFYTGITLRYHGI